MKNNRSRAVAFDTSILPTRRVISTNPTHLFETLAVYEIHIPTHYIRKFNLIICLVILEVNHCYYNNAFFEEMKVQHIIFKKIRNL